MAPTWKRQMGGHIDVQDSEVVTCEMRAMELATERRLNYFPPPKASFWKNNLTALSQYRNLYFVSSGPLIYVYEPEGPRVGAKPKLIIKPDLVEPHARGFSRDESPHVVNHLVTGDLGADEILLFATDSGNIGAYNVPAIASAIEDTEALSNEVPNPWEAGTRVHCFFKQFTGCSTWGLAIHKHARMIATAANSHELTVFAFALEQEGSRQGSRSPQRVTEQMDARGWSYVAEQRELDSLKRMGRKGRRSVDLRIEYAGHTNNIPSVSFLNSDLDQHADFMVSVDIDNKMFIWRVWESIYPYRKIDLSLLYTPRPNEMGLLQRFQRGWGVVALDPRHFRTKTLLNVACPGGLQHDTYSEVSCAERGLEEPEEGDMQEYPHEIDDILGRTFYGDSGKQPHPKLEYLMDKQWDIDGTGRRGARTIYTEGVPLHVEVPSVPNSPRAGLVGNGDDPDVDWDPEELNHAMYRSYLQRTYGVDYRPDFINLQYDTQTPARVHWENEFALPKGHVNCPIALFAETEVRLFSGPYAINASTIYDHPTFSQHNRTPMISRSWERLNHYQVVPELGLLVVASQRGRVCIFAMTDVPAEGPTLRLEHVVPTSHERVHGPIMGIAVGPIASQLPNRNCEKLMPAAPPMTDRDYWKAVRQPFRRYRLLVYYLSQTIVHYELSYAMPEDMRGPANAEMPNEKQWLLVRSVEPVREYEMMSSGSESAYGVRSENGGD